MRARAFGPLVDVVREVHDRLLARYGAQGWWPADTRFEVIVGALLMPQTSWRNVAQAIRNLRSAGFLDPHALASANVATLRKHVRIAGLHRTKPARLKAFGKHLLRACGGDLSRYFQRATAAVRADLLAQPGVGPETADSILLYAGDHPVFVVDAYTVRIGRRLGLFSTDRYRDVQSFFESRLPLEVPLFQEYHALLVEHAKTTCRPRPNCGACVVVDLCAYGRSRKP